MLTLKFGGTSVADAAAIDRLRAIVANEARPRAVVVSALAGITDQLLETIALAESGDGARVADALQRIRDRHASVALVVRDGARRAGVLAELDAQWADLQARLGHTRAQRSSSPASRDAIVACGELASSRLVAAALADAGVPAAWVDGRAVVATDATHEQAVPLVDETARRVEREVAARVRAGLVPVVGGFVGSTADGVTTTLGRGGSDLSASLIGAALGASEIEIWTDTDGVLTADPRVLEGARTVDRLSCREASALAHFGAKVLHPATVAPAAERGIPVRVLNGRRPAGRGTVITARAAGREAALAGLAAVADAVLLDVELPRDATREQRLADAFGACATAGARVYVSTIGDGRVSIVVGGGPAASLAASALAARGRVRRRDAVAIVAAVGDGLADGRVRPRHVLQALRGIALHAVSAAPGSGYVVVAVPRRQLADATARLHARFFETGGSAGRGFAARPAVRARAAAVPAWRQGAVS